MGIVVISDEALKGELLGESLNPEDIEWVTSVEEAPAGAQLVADLLFVNDRQRIDALKKLGAGTVIINSVEDTLAETDPSFVRMNGWRTFLQGGWIECAGAQEKKKAVAEFFALFGKEAEWVADEPGFITPRVVSMIINEAFHALSENVSTKEDINTAMKLGTNYPYGPFEWADKIGLEKVHALLKKLSKSNPRYEPASGLTARTL